MEGDPTLPAAFTAEQSTKLEPTCAVLRETQRDNATPREKKDHRIV